MTLGLPTAARTRLCRERTVLTVCTLVVTTILISLPYAWPASANGDLPIQDSLFDRLLYVDQLFIGRIVGVREVEYVPSGPCAAGITPGTVTEVELETQEVLHGAGIDGVTAVRWDRTASDTALHHNDLVLVMAARTCADGWRLWGTLARLNEADEIQARGQSDLGRKIISWTTQHDRKPTLSELRSYLAQNVKDTPVSAFKQFQMLHLVRVDTLLTDAANNRIDLRCSELAVIAGHGRPAPTDIRLNVPLVPMMRLSVGDTLLVPSNAVDRSSRREFAGKTNYFLVRSGYLPGLGVPLSNIMERFTASQYGFELNALPGRRER